MNYKRKKYISHKGAKYNIHQKKSFNITGILKITLILSLVLITILGTKNIVVSTGEDHNSFKTSLFFKAINNSAAVIGASSNNLLREEDKGISAFNLMEMIKSEIGIFKNKNDSKSTFTEDFNINSFNLGEEAIQKNEVATNKNITPEQKAKNAEKRILIYNSHNCEAYSPGEASKKDPSNNITAVTTELANQLQSYGFTVIYDKTKHDTVYNDAYYVSRQTVKNYLNKYGEGAFDLIIDMHRDSGPDKKYVSDNINGEPIAKIMFVPTTANPRYPKQLEKMEGIISIAKQKYPQLFRGKAIFDAYTTGITYYNQDLTDSSVLIEVGATTNTLEEAKNSMKYLAEVIKTYFSGN